MTDGFRFPKSRHLLKTDEISSVFSFRRRFYGDLFMTAIRPNALGHPRLAVVVGKKTAKRAVARNYIKRVVRETFRLAQHDLPAWDIVVQAKKAFGPDAFAGARDELRRHLRRIKP